MRADLSPRHPAAIVLLVVVLATGFQCRSNAWQEDQDKPAQGVMLGVNFADQKPLVWNVMPNSAADHAGIRAGDELLSIDGRYVIQPIDVARLLKGRSAGETVRLEVVRDGTILFFDLKLSAAIKPGEFFAADGSAVTRTVEYGMVGERFPDITHCHWRGLSPGKNHLRREDLAGKIAVIMVFQVSSEYTATEALPLLSKWYYDYRHDPDVLFFAVQNSFPPHEKNTMESAVALLEQFRLPIPIGLDQATSLDSTVCKLFQAPGHPWFVIVDAQGIIRYDGAVDDFRDDVIGQMRKNIPAAVDGR
jgi:PDZ domain